MADPAEHEARNDAERTGMFVGSPEDNVEALAMADAAGDPEEQWGSWLWGERTA